MPVQTNIRVVRTAFMKQWARNPGRERWEMQPINFPHKQDKKIWAELEALGMVNALKPSKNKYDFVIIFGATIPVMIQRFEYLITLYNEGVRFRQLSILATQRPINKKLEGSPEYFEHMKTTLPCHQAMPAKNESEAAKMIYRCIDLPPDMAKISVDFYDLPREFKALRWERAGTRECIIEWIRQNKKSSSILAISSQPFAPYQYAVLRSELRSAYSVEVVAPKIHPAVTTEVGLDAVASWLEYYNSKLRKNAAIEIKK